MTTQLADRHQYPRSLDALVEVLRGETSDASLIHKAGYVSNPIAGTLRLLWTSADTADMVEMADSPAAALQITSSVAADISRTFRVTGLSASGAFRAEDTSTDAANAQTPAAIAGGTWSAVNSVELLGGGNLVGTGYLSEVGAGVPGQALRHAAGDRHDVDVGVAVVLGAEGEPAPVRGETRVHLPPRVRGQSAGAGTIKTRDP